MIAAPNHTTHTCICTCCRYAGLTTTYTCTGSDWRELSRPQPARPLASVVLEPGLVDTLVADCQRCLDTSY